MLKDLAVYTITPTSLDMKKSIYNLSNQLNKFKIFYKDGDYCLKIAITIKD